MLKIPLKSHIEQSLIVFKTHLGKWILVNFEGTSLNFSMIFPLLAHLSQRLIGELIGYPWSGVRPSVRRRPSSVHNAQTSSSQKPLGRSKQNFMWSLLG